MVSDNKHISSVYWIHNKISQPKLKALLGTANHINSRKSRKTLKESNKANNQKDKHRPSGILQWPLCPWPASLELFSLMQGVMQVSADQTILVVVKYFMHPFVAVTEENRNCATSTRPGIIISIILMFTLWGPHSHSQSWLMDPFTLLHSASEGHIQKLPRSMAGVRSPRSMSVHCSPGCLPALGTGHRAQRGTAKAVIREGQTALP